MAIHFRFLEVATVMSKKSTKVIDAFAPMFTSFGFSFSLRSDNAPQFVSKEFEAVLRTNGIGPPGTYLVKTPDFNMGITPKVKIPESEDLFGGRPGL